jgi:hypothetical protein
MNGVFICIWKENKTVNLMMKEFRQGMSGIRKYKGTGLFRGRNSDAKAWNNIKFGPPSQMWEILTTRNSRIAIHKQLNITV